MVRRVASGDPDRLAYRVRGDTSRVLGVLIVLIGLGVMAFAIHWLAGPGKMGAPRWIALVLAVGGGLLAVGGAHVAFGVAGVVMDRRQGVVTRWSAGLFGPVLRKTTPLSVLDRVAISRSRDYTLGWCAPVREQHVYPVRLEGARGEKIGIAKGERDPVKARQLGEEIAKFLGFRLVDGSLGAEIVREAAEVGTTLRERALGGAPRAPLPEPPKGLGCRSSVDGDTLALDIPSRRLGPLLARAASHMALVLGGIILILYLLGPPGEDDIVPICVGGALGLTLLLGAFLSVAVERSQVRVSPRELRVTRRRLIRSRTTAIPADRLRDLEIVDEPGMRPGLRRIFCRGRAILARSDTESVFFGAGLSPEELQWIKGVIESVVSVGL